MSNKKKSILYIDDELSNLTTLKYMFKDEFDIFLAENGKQGLEIFSSENIDVVLCDQRMPGMSGTEVLEKIYALNPNSVRIIITGYSDYGSVVDAINKGHIYNYISKPWDETKLRMQIRNAIKAGELAQHNKDLTEELTISNTILEQNLVKVQKSESKLAASETSN